MDAVDLLLGTSVFRGMRRDDVAEMLPHLRERRFARGETVWREGDAADSLYVVATGQLKSHRISRDGAEVILALHTAGECTGEVGMFHPSGLRQVNVSAMSVSHCLTLHRDPLLAFVARHPLALRQLLGQLALMTVQAAYSFSGVAFDDIRTRVARTLLDLGEGFGEPAPDGGVRIRLQLSQGTLAALVAASRENVNRALAGFLAEGIVSQRQGHFHLHDRPALLQIASVGHADL